MVEKTRIGPFQISGRLGKNRRLRVFRARQIEQGRDVALKFIRLPPDVEHATALHKIQREVGVLKQLVHPHLVKVFGAGVDGDEIFFAYELIEGESLATLLGRRQKLAPDLAVEYARQIAAALQYLHGQEIVHGKLTPDKILIDGHNQIHLADVRLNRAKRRGWDAADRRDLDSAAYMAPEQFEEGAHEKSDLYALGAILYEMLTGHIHLVPETYSRLHQQKLNALPPSVSAVELDCPIWLDRLVSSLVQADPRKRPHSAAAVVYALEEMRKVDQNQTPVVRQMTSGFNPLTAGADKSEARRLLGQETKPVDETPLVQRTWFQVAVLVAIVTVIVWGAWPPSNQALWQRASRLATSNEIGDLHRAAEHFGRIVERGGDDPLTEQARQQLLETRGRILMTRIQSGYVGLEPKTRMFADAFDAERGGAFDAAELKYRQLIAQVGDDPDAQHFCVEAEKRLTAIAQQRAKAASQPETEPADSIGPIADPAESAEQESPAKDSNNEQ